jgi:hypothetical protein
MHRGRGGVSRQINVCTTESVQNVTQNRDMLVFPGRKRDVKGVYVLVHTPLPAEGGASGTMRRGCPPQTPACTTVLIFFASRRIGSIWVTKLERMRWRPAEVGGPKAGCSPRFRPWSTTERQVDVVVYPYIHRPAEKPENRLSPSKSGGGS